MVVPPAPRACLLDRLTGRRQPVGLWLVEDSPGWENANPHRLRFAPSARIYEIDGTDAWADCVHSSRWR